MIGRSGPGALPVLFTPRAIRELLEGVTWWRKNRLEAPRWQREKPVGERPGELARGLSSKPVLHRVEPGRCGVLLDEHRVGDGVPLGQELRVGQRLPLEQQRARPDRRRRVGIGDSLQDLGIELRAHVVHDAACLSCHLSVLAAPREPPRSSSGARRDGHGRAADGATSSCMTVASARNIPSHCAFQYGHVWPPSWLTTNSALTVVLS